MKNEIRNLNVVQKSCKVVKKKRGTEVAFGLREDGWMRVVSTSRKEGWNSLLPTHTSLTESAPGSTQPINYSNLFSPFFSFSFLPSFHCPLLVIFSTNLYFSKLQL